MYRWLSAAQIIIVHTGKIIMNKREGVNEFERAGQSQGQGALWVAPGSLAGSHDKQTASPLTPI
jgi:hypothetical protein